MILKSDVLSITEILIECFWNVKETHKRKILKIGNRSNILHRRKIQLSCHY
jgi:hypothetical protein